MSHHFRAPDNSLESSRASEIQIRNLFSETQYPMEPVGLSLSVLTALKEVYLLSKFVFNTLASVNNHKTEQQYLRFDFYHEFEYTRSFGRLFLQTQGQAKDVDLNAVSQFL